MTKRELEEIRDKLAKTFMIDPEVDQGVSKESFRAGFDACMRELWPRLEEAIGILKHEFIELSDGEYNQTPEYIEKFLKKCGVEG